MLSRVVKSISFFIMGVILLCIITGCSSGSSNPISPQSEFNKSGPGNLDSVPIIAFDGNTAIGVMGGYNLTISNDGKNADLVPMRSSAIGESYTVSGEAFFTMTPCTDCLRIKNVALDVNENIVLSFEIKHPFPRGNVSEEPSARNRLDLDVFDLALVVKPLYWNPDHYSLTNVYAYPRVVRNADGYTNELTGVTGENSVLPYKICYESANNNRFEMGTGYQPFDVIFSPGENLTFDLYLTMGYGLSTSNFTQRLNPTYFVPEFNRKPAWKVKVDPVSWVRLDQSTVTIDIYDWNHGATVASSYPDPAYTSHIAAPSDIQSVTVEVPGMTHAIVTAETSDTFTNGWDDPITYTATFNNEKGAREGIHFGLVKVTDSRTPGTIGSSDSTVRSPDGSTQYEYYTIPEFATYQTFIATIVDEGLFHDNDIELYEDSRFPGVKIPVAKRQLVIHYKEGMYSHILDLINSTPDAYLVGQILAANTVQVVIGDGISLKGAIQYCEADSAVISARPNLLIRTDVYPDGEPDSTLPPFAERRWHLDQVQAPQAWDLLSDDDTIVKIGVVDSGLDYDNFDGQDFTFDTSDLPGITDNTGHGTHIAGIIGASGNNNNGTLGMAWNANLYPFNVYSDNANGFSLDEMTAVKTLVDRGCKVINISMSVPLQLDVNGDGDYDDTGDYYVKKADRPEWSAEYKRFPYLNEFEYCRQHNVILIKSAGDDYNSPLVPPEAGEDGQFQDDIPVGHHEGSLWITDYNADHFKAIFPNILFVSATDSTDNYCDFSNRGLTERISAPGQRIYSSYSTDAPDPQNGYEIENSGQSAFASGTSMSAPMVSGVVALVRSRNQYLTPEQIVDMVIETADVGPDANTGRINAYKAVLADPPVILGSGNLMWAKRAGGEATDIFIGGDYGSGITTLSDNSTVVTGMFGETATFGPGDINETVLTSDGANDIFIARYNPDGTLAWAKRAGGIDGDYGSGITKLSDDSIVVCGIYNTPATFGPGEPNQTTLTVGDKGIFIARYNPNGTLSGVRCAANEGVSYGITTLSDNSIVITGMFSNPITFDPGGPNEITLNSAGNHDIFIARFNPDGSLSWVKSTGSSDSLGDIAYAITSLSDNSIVITGYFSGSAIFGQSESNETILNSAGEKDLFIARYNPDGSLLWAKLAGGSGWDHGLGITTLSDNSIVVTGSFANSATFGPGETNQTILTSESSDFFIARYNSDGTLSWVKNNAGTGGSSGRAITTRSDNSTVVTGQFIGITTFGAGEPNETVLDFTATDNDIFIACYNPNGTLSWAKRISGYYSEGLGGITTLSDNSTVVTGYFANPWGGTATFGPAEPNETILTSAGGPDIFIARFEP